MRLPVLAKSHNHFQLWCDQAGIGASDCVYLSGPNALRGYRLPVAIGVGDWISNENYTTAFRQAMQHCIDTVIEAKI